MIETCFKKPFPCVETLTQGSGGFMLDACSSFEMDLLELYAGAEFPNITNSIPVR